MSLTPAQIGKILDTLEVLNMIGEAVKARAIVMVHQGVKIPGWEAAITAPRRAWVEEEAAIAHLKQLGLGVKEIYSVTPISPASAEDVLRKKGKWPKGKKHEFTPLDSVLKMLPGNPTIKRVSK